MNTPPRSNNSSGIVGLRLRLKRAERGRDTWRVQAFWRHRGQLHGTEFSVDAHGPIKATELAIQARERGTGKRMGVSARQAWGRLRAGWNAELRGRPARGGPAPTHCCAPGGEARK